MTGSGIRAGSGRDRARASPLFAGTQGSFTTVIHERAIYSIGTVLLLIVTDFFDVAPLNNRFRLPSVRRRMGENAVLTSENAMPRIANDATMNEKIAQMVKVIVNKFKPEQIILFGSRARGDAGPDSDVDLLVVMDVEGSRNETALDVQQALHGISVPVDIVISLPAEFAWRKEVVGTIEYPASHEGKVLYAHS